MYNRENPKCTYNVVMNLMKSVVPLIFLLFVFSLSTYAVANEMDDMVKMSGQLKDISKKLSRGQFEGDDLNAWTKLTIKMKGAASSCISNSETVALDLKETFARN